MNTPRLAGLLFNIALRFVLIASIAGCQPTATKKHAGTAGAGSSSSSSAISTDNSQAIERTAEKGPVRMTVSVSPTAPRLSDLVEMQIDLTAPSGVEVKAPSFGQSVDEFLIRDYKELPAKGGNEPTRSFWYQLEPMSSGTHLLKSIAVEFIDRRAGAAQNRSDVIESAPIEVHVSSAWSGDKPSLSELAPMLPPRDINRSPLWPFILGIGLLAALLAIVFVWRRRKRTESWRMAIVVSPEEIARKALEQLKADDLPARGEFKEYYLRLTGIVRHYIEGTTGVKAPEQTTQEFLTVIAQRRLFDRDRSERLREFLEAADMVKYAGQQPDPVQIEASMDRAREFITPTVAEVPHSEPSLVEVR